MQTLLHTSPPATGRVLPAAGVANDVSSFGPDLLALLVDEWAHGVLVVTPRGWILHANPAARSELHGGAVLNSSHGELKARAPADKKLLALALDKAASGQRSLIRLAEAGVNFTVALVPLNRQTEAPCERIALFFSRAEVCDSSLFAAFARSQRLTRTEERVLAHLCRCLSTPEIAVQMKVAVSTVRSHVRSLCVKTGTRGVRELINRVAVLPPLAAMGPASQAARSRPDAAIAPIVLLVSRKVH